MGLPADSSPRSWGRGDGSPAGAAGPAAFWLSEGCRAPGAAGGHEQEEPALAQPGGSSPRLAPGLGASKPGRAAVPPGAEVCGGAGEVGRFLVTRCVASSLAEEIPPLACRGRTPAGIGCFWRAGAHPQPSCRGTGLLGASVSGHGTAPAAGGLRGRQAAGALPASGTGAEPGLQPRALLGSSDQAQILPWVPALQSATPAPIAATEHSQELASPQPLPPSCPQIPAGVPATALPLQR